MTYRDRKLQKSQLEGRGRRWMIGIVTVSLVIGSGVWFVKYLRASSQIARVKELQQQLAESQKLPEAQRRELRSQMREEMEQLPDSTRRDLWQEQRAQFESRMDDQMKKVLLLPPDQRTAELDKQIDEMEKRRKEFEQRRQQRAASVQTAAGQNAAGQNGPPGAGQQQRGRGGRQRTPDPTGKVSLERTKRRMDQSTPEQRATREEYRRLVEARRQQRGLPANPWPGRL